MNARHGTFAFSLCLIFSSWVQAQAPDPARIDALVRKLGSSAYAQREVARRELESIGTPALEFLRKLSKSSDADTARRLADLIRGFEEQLLTQQVLAPKEVNLKLKDVSVQQAITELATVSGYPIQFQGDATRLADKRISLDTGRTSFWQAFDQLCKQAGLMERVNQATSIDQPMYYQGGKGGRIMRGLPTPMPQPMQPTGPIVVTNRGKEKSLVSHAGAVRTEVRISRDASARELNLQFIVSVEPRLQNTSVIGRPVLAKVVDQQGKRLAESLEVPKANPKAVPMADDMIFTDMSMSMMAPHGGRVTQIRVKEGEQAAKQLKELAGKLGLQLDLQNVLLAKIDNVMEASGKSVAGANGGTMKVGAVKKLPDGNIEVQVSMDNLTPSPFGGNIIMNGNGGVIIRGNVIINGGGMVIGPNGVRVNGGGNGRDLPDLLDAKGQKYRVANLTNDSFNFVNGSSTRNATVVFAPNPGQAEPRELALFGTRTCTISVPFRFENLQVP